jgi:hypothetical protein
MIEPSVLAIGSGALRRRTAIASYDNLPQAARNGSIVIQGVFGRAKPIVCPQASEVHFSIIFICARIR